MVIQGIDVASVVLCREEHHRMYKPLMENKKVLAAAQCWDALVKFAYLQPAFMHYKSDSN